MKRCKRIVMLLCAVMIFALCACGFTNDKPKEGVEVHGKKLVVSLESNESTGYTWNYTTEGDDCLSLVSKYVLATEEKDGKSVGVSEITEFTFSALDDGEQTLHFVYERTFEENSEARAYDITAKVSNGKISIVSQHEATVGNAAAAPSAAPTATAAPSAMKPSAANTPTPTAAQPTSDTADDTLETATGLVVSYDTFIEIRTDDGDELYLTPLDGSFPEDYYPSNGDYVSITYNPTDSTLIELTLIGSIAQEAN